MTAKDKDDRKEAPKTEPAAPAGGKGGSIFKSGVNKSGVFEVHIESGPYYKDGRLECKSTIQRVYLRFLKPSSSNNMEPSYLFFEKKYADENRLDDFAVDVNTGDKIVKALVWSDGRFVNALQFFTSSGCESQIYGLPDVAACPPVEFAGEEGAELVGVYGSFGSVLHGLGFQFAVIGGFFSNVVESRVESSLTPSGSDHQDSGSFDADFVDLEISQENKWVEG